MVDVPSPPLLCPSRIFHARFSTRFLPRRFSYPNVLHVQLFTTGLQEYAVLTKSTLHASTKSRDAKTGRPEEKDWKSARGKKR